MTVGIGPRDSLSTDHPARARDVLDDHALPQMTPEVLGDDPRHDVGPAAGRKRQHQSDGARRIALGKSTEPQDAIRPRPEVGKQPGG